MTESKKKNKYLPVIIMFAAFVAVSTVLYCVIPSDLKGIAWCASFILQAFVSYYVPAFFFGKDDKQNYRLHILRHMILQVLLCLAWCALGLISRLILKEKSGFLSLALCILATGVFYFTLPEKWVFAKGKTATKLEKMLLSIDEYLYAFLTVFTIHMAMYAVFSVYPFGDCAYLRMDCYHQYAPFIKEFCARLHNGEGLFFNWNSGLGVNYWSHFCYYLSSPSNFLYLMIPEKYILEGIAAGIALKGALSSVTFLYYLRSRQPKKDYFRFVFGVFYGLSAFYLAYSCNIMWADCYVLFPLIMLGIEQIAKGKKPVLYGFAMCLCIFSNFYLAAITGIAVVFYFQANLIIYRKEGNTFKKIGAFIYTTIVILLIAGIVLLPEFYCLKNTAAGRSAIPAIWESYFPLHELLSRMLANVETIQNNSELPNIYCSVFALMCLVFYFGNRKIRLSKKIVNGLLLSFLLLSFQWNLLYFLWNGLHFPNSFPARFSFFFIFLVLSMAYECFEKRSGLHKIYIVVSTGVLFAGCVALWWFLSREDLLNSISTYLCSGALISFYAVVLLLERKITGRMMKNILVILMLLEISVNALAVGINSVVDRTAYLDDEKNVHAAILYLDEINDGRFYRIERPDRMHINSGSIDGYHSASYFSSTISDGVMNFYADMGMRYSDVAYCYQGGNPLLSSLLGIDYYVSSKDEHIGTSVISTHLPGEDGSTIYVDANRYSLGLGFGIPVKSYDVYPKMEDKAPFKNQDSFARMLGAKENLYRILPVVDYVDREFKTDKGSKSGRATVYHVKAGEHPYFYVNNYLDRIQIINRDMDGNYIEDREEAGLKFRRILDLGVYDTDREIIFLNNDDPEEELHFQAYVFRDEVYEKLMAELSKDVLELSEVKNGYLKGRFKASNDEILFFNIPYDSGFTVTVDGYDVKPKAAFNAFLSVPVAAGEHEVEVHYMPPGFVSGLKVTFIGILSALAGYFISSLVKLNREKKKHAEG